VPNELLDELEAEVKEAEAEVQTADDDGVKEVEAEQQAEPVESDETPVEVEEEEEKETPRVPLPELQAERKKRQDAQAELQAEKEKFARLDERLNIINERFKPQEPEIPAYEEDPFEHLRQKENQTGKTVEDLQKQMEENTQHQQAAAAQAELTQRVVFTENEFRVEHPDYDDAVKHLRMGRAQEFIAMGIADPVQIEQMLNQEAVQLTQMAAQNNANVAEMAYNIAKSRGYAKAAKQPGKLDTIEKGQQKSTSLSNAGGSEERVLDIDVLAEMDDADFADAMKEGKWGKIMGAT